MPKFTLDNSFRFYSQKETILNFHSESIDRLLQKLTSADWLRLFARQEQIQAYLFGWKNMLLKINDVLADAMKKQATNQSVNMWLAKLQNLAYDAEDLLDEFPTEAFQRLGEATSQASTSHQPDSMAMAKVKDVNVRFQEIASQIDILGLKSRYVRRRLTPTSLIVLLGLKSRKVPIEIGPAQNAGNSGLVFFEGCNLVFELEDLLRASAELLGKGTFGTAYKVTLEDAKTVVVKRMKGVNVGKREFEQQMEVVGSIRHENVAALRGYYYSKDEKFPVYDYFEQGCVSDMIHGKRDEGQSSLDWETRVRIAVGAARGIAHIHTKKAGKFVHGGIKATNIFLNSQGHVCVSDIGLAALTSPMPQPAKGTAGYRAPEVTDTRKATQASDVYSFGVLLLELLTGKSPMHATGGDKVVHLVSWVTSVAREEWTGEVFDVGLLRYPNIKEEMVAMLQIGMACVVRVPEQRPKMVDVVKMVEEIRQGSTKNVLSVQKSRRETTSDFHSESIERLLQKLASDWLPVFAREKLIQADLLGWKKILGDIKDVLDDAMKKQVRDQSVKTWLAQLQNLAYDVEDLLDKFQTESFKRPGEATSQLSTSYQFDSMAMSEVKEVNSRLQDIASQIVLLGLKSGNVGNSRLVLFEGHNFVFDLEDLFRASAELLGKGTFGTAYKATLEDGSIVVVKRLKGVNVVKREFEQQMEVVGRTRHENVAALKAFYYSKDEKLLVYDYFEQGSVSAMFHGRRDEGQSSLDWETRVRIAVGVARGIAHIHTKNDGKLVHGGIKASNIFLNSEGHVCVSDVGLEAMMSSMKPPPMGAAGYRAPEVTETRKATQASDVYGFGVLLLELLTGKSPVHATGGDKTVHLVSWIISIAREEWTAEVFDVDLLWYLNIEEEMVQMLQIGMDCVRRVPEQRPKMVDVVKMIEDIRRVKNDVSILKSSEISSLAPTPKATEIASSSNPR